MRGAAKHRCPWPGCPKQVDSDLWGCKGHWFAIPRELRMALWKAYRRGQTIWTVSPEYGEAALAIARWIEAYTAAGGSTSSPHPVREASQLDERQGDLPL